MLQGGAKTAAEADAQKRVAHVALTVWDRTALMQVASQGGLLFHARVGRDRQERAEGKMHDMCGVHYLGLCS